MQKNPPMSAFVCCNRFPEAHFFFNRAISLLRANDWGAHYQLCCDVYMQAADAASLIADYRSMESCLRELFQHCKVSIVDFLNASYIRARSLIVRDDPAALDVCLQALRYADEKFPQQNFLVHTVVSISLSLFDWLDHQLHEF